MDKSSVLVVDDDPQICEMLREFLTRESYKVDTATSGAAARRFLKGATPDLVILDLLLPDEDGLSLARHIRERAPSIGIIMLTGRGEPVDRIIGLETGADDYLTKPVMLRELAARVRSVLRRLSPLRRGEGAATLGKVRFAGRTFDMGARCLIDGDGRKEPLTTAEFELLTALVTHPNRVLSRDQLLDLARGRNSSPFDRSIDVLIGKLRRKIEPDPDQPTVIQTVRGAGYIFTAMVDTAS